MALLGQIDSFNHNSDGICEYIQRVDQYFYVNDINDATKKTAIFLTVIGSNTYSLLRNLLAPVSPSTKTVEESQKENETISDYIALLQKLASNCNFREFLDEVLRDRFVCGLIDGSIRRRLLAEQAFTLKIAIDLAKALKSAEIETKLINTEIKAENQSKNLEDVIDATLMGIYQTHIQLKSVYATLAK